LPTDFRHGQTYTSAWQKTAGAYWRNANLNDAILDNSVDFHAKSTVRTDR
jgi:hypothetical protein